MRLLPPRAPRAARKLLTIALPQLLLVLTVLLAPAAASAEECPNAAFRTGPSAALPDCRAYEMVTPPFKNGDLVEPGFFNSLGVEGAPLASVRPGLDGESVPFRSINAFAGAEDSVSAIFTNYVGYRTPVGWQTTAMMPSAASFLPDEIVGLSGDEQTVLWLMRGVSQGDNTMDFYRLSTDGSVVDVGPAVAPTSGEVLQFQPGLNVAGVSADASHIVFQDHGAWSFAPAGALLEYAGTGNTEPMLVGVDDEGGFADHCPTQELGGASLTGAGIYNPISADGETVFFSDTCKHELFARIGNGQPGAHTVAISEPTVADCAACDTEPGVRQPSYYLGSSEDGSKAFFATTQPLLGNDASMNVYEYDFDAPPGERVVKVSGGDGSVSNPTAGVLGAVQVSPDGSHVYFVATGVLTSSPSYDGRVAQPGADNLYMYERDASFPGGRIAFVAAVPGESGLWVLPTSTSAITSDGRFLVFASSIHLTANDASSGRQLFEYDSQANQLRRVSIGQNGFNDNGNTASVGLHFNVSSDGSYVFFESSAGLTPQALNYHVLANNVESNEGSIYANNIYEYHNGNVYLISDGQDVAAFGNAVGEGRALLELAGASASGRDVFFTTADRLVGQDSDTSLNIYDARIDGGFPGPPAPVECQADACQGLLSSAPVLLSPGSELQAGGENVVSGQPAVAASPKVAAKSRKAKAKHAKRKRRVGKRARRSSVRGTGSGRR